MPESDSKKDSGLIQTTSSDEVNPATIVASAGSKRDLKGVHSDVANTAEVIETSLDKEKFAPGPGHVFKAGDLPKDKQHLVDALYVGDNEDGTMFVLSAEQFSNDFDTWNKLHRIVGGINENGGFTRIPTNKDWDRVLGSQFVQNARLDIYNSFPRNVYWAEGISGSDYAHIRFPYEINRDYNPEHYPKEQSRNLLARGRFVADEEKFWELEL